ncbi:YrzQ family protein [Pontibacillus halophilus]|nr:YrzQ family protein [Pontibacillus halophilus]
MNRTITSLAAMGIGAYLYSTARERDLFSQRSMKRMRKRFRRAFR